MSEITVTLTAPAILVYLILWITGALAIIATASLVAYLLDIRADWKDKQELFRLRDRERLRKLVERSNE